MDSWAFISILNGFGLYTSILLASGTVFYCLLFETTAAKQVFSSKKIILAFSWLGIVTTLLSYGLTAISLTGEIQSSVDSEILTILWQTPAGKVLALRLTGLALIISSLFFLKNWLFLAVIGCLISLASFTQIGHSSTSGNNWLALLLLIHLVGISLWLGILMPLLKLCGQIKYFETTINLARRFSQIASLFVPTLIIAGIVLAVQLVGSVENLLTTNYGKTLLGKIAIVAGVLCLALLNKIKFAPKLTAAQTQTLKAFRLSILIESIFILGALFTTAILTNLFPAPSL